MGAGSHLTGFWRRWGGVKGDESVMCEGVGGGCKCEGGVG